MANIITTEVDIVGPSTVVHEIRDLLFTERKNFWSTQAHPVRDLLDVNNYPKNAEALIEALEGLQEHYREVTGYEPSLAALLDIGPEQLAGNFVTTEDMIMSWDEKKIIQWKERCRESLDRQDAIPRPNWPDNVLDFHKVLPVPGLIQQSGYSRVGVDWCVENWGCYEPWLSLMPDSSVQDVATLEDGQARLSFTLVTPWAAPLDVFENMAVFHPSIQIQAFSSELEADAYSAALYENGSKVGETKLSDELYDRIADHDYGITGEIMLDLDDILFEEIRNQSKAVVNEQLPEPC